MAAVTERPKVASKTGDTQFLEILKSWSQGIVIRQGKRVVFVNQALTEMCGYDSPEAVMALSSATLLVPEDERERVDRYYAARIAEREAPTSYQLRILRKNGSPWWSETRAQIISWEGAPAVMFAVSDISERKRAEDALNESEQRFRSLVEGSIQGMVVSRGSQALFANQECARILGYDSLAEMIRAGPLEHHIHPDDREDLMQRAAARLRGEAVPAANTLRALRKDGSEVWLEGRATLVEWDGEPAVQSVFHDITDRREAQQALAASERRFRNLVEGSIQGLLVHVGTTPKFANQALADILGYDSPAEILGVESVNDLMYPADVERILRIRAARLRGQPAPDVVELRGLRRDGSPVWVESRATVVEWDGEQAIHSTIVDISEREKAAATLVESEARFKDFAEMAADWIWETDAEHRMVFMSDRYYELTGYSPADVIGKARHEAPAFRHNDQAVRDLLALFDKREAYRGHQLRIRKANGEVIHGLSSGNPLFDKDGTFVGFRGTSTDYTARKHAEDALRSARDDLEVKVGRRTRELRNEVAERQLAQQEAIQASRAKSEFLSSMSHELRTPLNAILGFAQLLRDFSDAPLSDEQAANLEHILSASKHLLGLINDVLDLSRIEEGRLNLSVQSVELNHCIRDCVTLVRPLAVERDISIIDECGDTPGLRLKADPTRLKQILLNIISNAIKYNRDCGIVRVSAAAIERGMIRISVADTGPGIPNEKRGEVFRPFSRLGAEASAVEGTGIGLTISRQLVESMGGRLDFDSTLGEGSTFWIDVPSADG